MRILLISANKFGFELFKTIQSLKDVEIIAVITLKKSATTVMFDGIQNRKWFSLNERVIEIDRINEEYDLIKKLNPELIILCGWRQIVDERILGIPKYGTIGFHPTILPYGRGPAPIINTLLKGLSESGVSMFYLNNGLDNGDIIAQEKFKIKPTDHADKLYRKIIKAGKKILKKAIPQIINGKASRIRQDDSKAEYFAKPDRDSNKINLDKDKIELIYRKIRAFSKPYKGAYFEKGNKRLIIWQAELQERKK